MSHTQYLDSVRISDPVALAAAVKELKDAGVNCDLMENIRPRAYYSSQDGMNTNAPLTLKLHGGPYDVGFYPTEKAGVLEPRFDNYRNQIGQILGVDRDTAQAPIGRLVHSYQIHATMRQAVKEGHSARRVARQNGKEQVVIRMAA